MTTPQPRIDQMAVASLVVAVVGVMVWVSRIVGGWGALLAATLSLVLGFLALSRIKSNGHRGRWAAFVGIGFGAVFYTFLIVIVVLDVIDPVKPHG